MQVKPRWTSEIALSASGNYPKTMTSDLTTGIFTIVGAIVGALATYACARPIALHHHRLTACAKFRAAFSPIQVAIRNARRGKRNGVGEFIENAIPHLAISVEEFSPFVPASDIDAYERAWRECEKVAELNDFVPKDDPYREIERVVHVLLSFAKQT